MRVILQLALLLCVIVAIEYAITLLAVAFLMLIVAGLIFEPANTIGTLALLLLIAGLSSHPFATIAVIVSLAGIVLIARQVEKAAVVALDGARTGRGGGPAVDGDASRGLSPGPTLRPGMFLVPVKARHLERARPKAAPVRLRALLRGHVRRRVAPIGDRVAAGDHRPVHVYVADGALRDGPPVLVGVDRRAAHWLARHELLELPSGGGSAVPRLTVAVADLAPFRRVDPEQAHLTVSHTQRVPVDVAGYACDGLR